MQESVARLLATPLGILKVSGGVALAGILLMLTGKWMAKLFNSFEKYNERQLERASQASFGEGMFLFLTNPDVTVPVSLIFVGGILVFGGVIGAIVALVRCFFS